MANAKKDMAIYNLLQRIGIYGFRDKVNMSRQE